MSEHDKHELQAVLYDLVAQHNEAIIGMNKSMVDLLAEMRAQSALYSACQETLASTVPDGDHDGHRRYHEAVIKKMEARAKLWQDVSSSVAKWGAIGILGWVGMSMWHEILAILSRLFVKG